MPPTRNRLVPCRVRTFAQPNAYGPHVAGEIVHVSPEELALPATRRALITVEEEERLKAEREQREAEVQTQRHQELERQREVAIAQQRRNREDATRRRER